MQILAHSLIPVNPTPYLHLGYISAYAEKTTTMPAGFDQLPQYGFIVIAIGLFIVLYAQRFTSRWKYLALVIPLLGLAMIIGAVTIRTPKRLVSPHFTMMQRLDLLHREVQCYLDEGKPVPTDINVLVKQALPRDQKSTKRLHTEDIWGTPFRITRETVEKAPFYLITSAGEDRRFDTIDDEQSMVIDDSPHEQ
jgi:hypothetical protein